MKNKAATVYCAPYISSAFLLPGPVGLGLYVVGVKYCCPEAPGCCRCCCTIEG
jgi:hypothetical protein